MIEELRDEVLTVPGLRWIHCGSTGIVRILAATPRLQGYLHAPVEVGNIGDEMAASILDSRVNAYRVRPNAYLPLTATDFSTLYTALHGNIRDALSAADDFCNYVADIGFESTDDSEKHSQFATWLVKECAERLEAARPIISARPWKLFTDIVAVGGQCSPSEYGEFTFDTQQATRSQVLRLEAANLVKSVRDEEDNRRKTLIVTSNGWLVHYGNMTGAGSLFEETLPPDPSSDENGIDLRGD